MTTRELDSWVLRIVWLLGAEGEAAYVVERLLRIGAFHPQGYDARDAAEKVGMSPRSLTRWMWRHGLPSPKTLLTWGRLLPAVACYATARSVEDAALATGWGSQGCLSKTFRHHARMHMAVWKRSGADMEALLVAFVRRRASGNEAAA